MNAKIFFGISLSLLITVVSCVDAISVDGNGKVTKQGRKISSFSELEVSGTGNVILSQGDKDTVIIETDENLQEYILTEVKNSELKIYQKKGVNNAKALNIYVTFKSIKDIDLSGAVDLKSTTALVFNDIEIEASGASEMNLAMTAAMINLKASGSSDILLSGNAKSLKMDMSGAGSLKATALSVDTAILEISGAGNAQINAKNNLDVQISGAGSVEYMGAPSIKKKISGAGSVNKL